MRIEDFDKLNASENVFDNLTGEFIGVFTAVCAAWENEMSFALYEFEWQNEDIANFVNELLAEENDGDFNDDVDETFYDPYMGCDCYDDCRIDEF